MVRLREVVRTDKRTKRFLEAKLKEREKELEIVKQAVNQIANDLEYDGKIEWQKTNAKELANKQSYKRIYDGSDWAVEEEIFYVINKNGEIVEVPVGDYKRDSAYETDYPVEWKKDIYVGDYINENTLAVVSYYRNIVTFRKYECYELNVYLLSVNEQEIKELLLRRIKEIKDLGKLMQLLARL